jgi:hypothetical protein
MNSCWNNEKCYEYLCTLRNSTCAYYTFFQCWSIFHVKVKKEPKICGSYPTDFVFWGHKWKITPVRPIPTVIQKDRSLTWKYLSKIGRTKFSFGVSHLGNSLRYTTWISRGFFKMLQVSIFGVSINIIGHLFFVFVQKIFVSICGVLIFFLDLH